MTITHHCSQYTQAVTLTIHLIFSKIQHITFTLFCLLSQWLLSNIRQHGRDMTEQYGIKSNIFVKYCDISLLV